MPFTSELGPLLNIVIEFSINVYLCFGTFSSNNNRQRFFDRDIEVTIKYEFSATSFFEYQLVISSDGQSIASTIAVADQSDFMYSSLTLYYFQCY